MQLTLKLLLFCLSHHIVAAELVGPKYRVVTSATLSSIFATGQVILGAVAWMIQPWRYMSMALHIPGFLVVTYYTVLPESVRWLLSKGKYLEAKKVLETVARINKTQISDRSLEALINNSRASLTHQAKVKQIQNLAHTLLTKITQFFFLN